jgi:acetyl-CoA synthetase
MLERRDTYETLRRDFAWHIPPRFNIGVAVADDWARREPGRVALIEHADEGVPATVSYGELARQSSALAGAMTKMGIARGDRVALLLPQSFETAITHVATYKLGAIAVPLALLFGVEALEYRLATAGAKLVVTTHDGLDKIALIRSRLPMLEHVIVIDGPRQGAHEFAALVRDTPPLVEVCDTGPDDPPARPRARCTGIAFSWVICRASRCRMNSCPCPATFSGRRRTGPGRAAFSTFSCPRFFWACRLWPVASSASPRTPRSA